MAKEELFVLVFGSCGWDKIYYMNEDGSKEFVYEEEGRKNSHQAVAVKRAGAKSMLVSFVGDDEIGKKALESLNKCGLDTRFVEIVKGESTEINYQLVDRVSGDYTLERGPANLSQNYDVSMVDKYKKYILKADCVVLVSKQPKDFLKAVIDFCYENNVATALTISHKKFDIDDNSDLNPLKKCSYIAANYDEVCALMKKESLSRDSLMKAFNLLPNIIMTKGKDGVYFVDELGNFCHEEAVKVEKVIEANGAGDTFIGNYIVYRSENKSIQESIRMALCASALKIQKMGVYSSMPYREETESLYKKYYLD